MSMFSFAPSCRHRPALPLQGLLALLLTAQVFLASTAEARRPRPERPTSAEDRQEAWQRHWDMDQGSVFRALPWRCVGPVVQGGRLVDIEVHPEDPYTFYVAYASGGLWRTSNNGLSFEPLFDHQPTMIMGDVALDPNDPARVWVGTGENNSSRSSYGGLGVFRSDDGGETWQAKGLADTDRIGRILVDPRDGERVLVAALGRLYTESGDRGLYLSRDGGDSWERVLEGEGFTGFVDLVRDPSDADVIYASSWERSRRPWDFVEGGEGSGIWKSTDAGETWERIEGGFPRGEHVGRIGLAISPSQPGTLYAYLDNQRPLPEEEWDLGDGAVTAKRLRAMTREEFLAQDLEEIEDFVRSNDFHPDVTAEKLVGMVREGEITLAQILAALEDANASLFDVDIEGPQVWRSDDAGATWQLMHDEPIRDMVYTYGYYFGQIRVSPTDVDRVYIMGVPILRSDDGGRTWRGLDDRVVHVDYQSMHIDPDDHDRVLVGNDGGLAVSWDGGLTWIELNSIPVGQFYTVAVDMEEPYNIYGGLQDNGTWKGSSRSEPDDENAWRKINGGDGFYVEVDDRDGTTYTGYQFGYYTRIDPDGSRHRVRPRNWITDAALRYNWMTPILLSSHNEDIVYFGTDRLYRSMDQGETWAALSDDLTRDENRGDVPFGTITTLDESHETFGVLLVGTDDGQLWRTRDGGVTWKDVADGLPRERWVSRVVISNHEPERAYVALNGYRDDDMTAYVYSSDDLGDDWRSIADGLPAEPVNVIREDPENEDVLYVGTDRGVYVSLDRGDSWQALPAGLPNVPVHDLVVHPRDRELVAGTHGRSVWVLDVEPLQRLDEEIRAATVHLYDVDEVQAQRSWRSRPSRWFYRPDEDDPSHRFHVWARDGGTATVEVRDDAERVLRRWEVKTLPGLNQLEWDLRLDEELALAAEQARMVEHAQESQADHEAGDDPAGGATTAAGSSSAAEDDEAVSEATTPKPPATPWADAVRLERPLYVTPGDYVLGVRIGEAESTAEFTVKAPPERTDRRGGPLTKPRLHP